MRVMELRKDLECKVVCNVFSIYERLVKTDTVAYHILVGISACKTER